MGAVAARGAVMWYWTTGAIVLACTGLLGLHLVAPGAVTVLHAGPGRLSDPVGDPGRVAGIRPAPREDQVTSPAARPRHRRTTSQAMPARMTAATV